MTFISSPLSTELPPDEVIIESTEISGQSVFEEVVDVKALQAVRDPMREKLFELAAGAALQVNG